MTRFFVWIVSLWLCLGVVTAQDTPSFPKIDENKAKAEIKRFEDYFLQSTLEAYKKTGNTNPKWDKYAEKALRWHALNLTPHVVFQSNQYAIGYLLSHAIRKEGCNDPYLTYLLLYYAGASTTPGEAYKIATKIHQSKYPAIRKLEASLTLYRLSFNSIQFYPVSQEALDATRFWLEEILTYWIEAAQAGSYGEHYELMEGTLKIANELLITLRGSEQTLEYLEKRLAILKDKDPAIHSMLMGAVNHSIVLAYRKRSVGAYRPSKFILESVGNAKKEYKEALKKFESYHFIWERLIELEYAGEGDRDEMEKAFTKAVTLYPASYYAYRAKAIFLLPQSYGTIKDEAIDFGRELAAIEPNLGIPWFGVAIQLLAHELNNSNSRRPLAKAIENPEIKQEIQNCVAKLRKDFSQSHSALSLYCYYAMTITEIRPEAFKFYQELYGQLNSNSIKNTTLSFIVESLKLKTVSISTPSLEQIMAIP